MSKVNHRLLTASFASFLAPGLLNLFAQTSFYVAPSGNDGNSGTSPAQPWRTLSRASQQVYQPGDSLLLQAGGVYRGTLHFRGSGNSAQPVVISSYGAGNKPLIAGDELLTSPSWTTETVGTTITWKTYCPDTAWFVFADDQLRFLARFPDNDFFYIDQVPSSGTFSFCGNSYPRDSVFIANALKTISLNDLNNAYVHIRMSGWTIGTFIVKSFDKPAGKIALHSSSYGWNGSLNLKNSLVEKHGFFFSNKKEFLSHAGEFWYDAAQQQLYVVGAGPPSVLSYSKHRYGIRLADTFAQHLIISNLAFGRQTISAIELKENDSDIAILNCDFRQSPFGLHNRGESRSADCHIRRAPTFRLNISNNTFTDIFREAISCFPRDATITYNTFLRNGIIANMAEWLNLPRSRDVVDFDNGSVIRSGRASWIAYNRMDSAGHYGIFANARCTVEYNTVRGACQNYYDCGAVYVAYSDSVVLHRNMVFNCSDNYDRGIWLNATSAAAAIVANGIYLDFNGDLRFRQLTVTENTIAGCGRGIGFLTTEDAVGQPDLYGNGYCSPPAEISGNILYDNSYEQFSIGALALPEKVPASYLYKPLQFTGNTLVHFAHTGRASATANQLNAGVKWGTYKHNYYLTLQHPYAVEKRYQSLAIAKTEWLTLAEWQQSGMDSASRQILPLQSHLRIQDTLPQGNLIRAGKFSSATDLNFWSLYTSASSLCQETFAYDSTAAFPSGHLLFKNPNNLLACNNNSVTISTQLADSSNNYSATVNLDSARYYLLTFKTLSSLLISNSGKPNTFWTVSLINTQNQAVLFSAVIEPRTTIETFRMIFKPLLPAAEVKLQFYSYQLQYDYILRIDDVALLPLSVSDWLPEYKFPLLSNATANAMNVNFPTGCLMHLDSSVAVPPITLPPYGSMVFIRHDTCSQPLTITGTPQALNTNPTYRLFLYPNPAAAMTHVVLPAHLQGHMLEAYSPDGRLLYQQKVTQPILSLNIAQWPSGMYLFRCGRYYAKLLKH